MTKFDKSRQQPELSSQQVLAADALMTGATDREAAERAGVSRQTVNKWKNGDPHFRAEMNLRRRELWYASKDRIRSLVPAALHRLEAELQGEDGDWRAALKVVELVGLGGDYSGGIGPTDPEHIKGQDESAQRHAAHMSELLDSLGW